MSAFSPEQEAEIARIVEAKLEQLRVLIRQLQGKVP